MSIKCAFSPDPCPVIRSLATQKGTMPVWDGWMNFDLLSRPRKEILTYKTTTLSIRLDEADPMATVGSSPACAIYRKN